jgi:hypothetical protein
MELSYLDLPQTIQERVLIFQPSFPMKRTEQLPNQMMESVGAFGWGKPFVSMILLQQI